MVVSDAPPAAPFFPSCRKRRGRKGALGCGLVRPASEFRRVSMFQASFHTIATLRASWYAPPDTGVPNLQLVALEYLLSIEGADQTYWSAPFCGEVIFICFALCRGGAEPRPYKVQSNERKLPRKKVQTSKSGLHLLFLANILRQLAANLEPPYQAARSMTPVR